MYKEFLRVLASEPLLQHGDLKKANNIDSPEKISLPLLNSWLTFAQDTCNMQGFQCLAFTELPETTREILGFSKKLPPRVIYHRSSMSNKGQFIINPTINTNFPKNPLIPIFEGCGSIKHGKLWYYIKRPGVLTVRGWFYDGISYYKDMIKSADPYIDLTIHETDHLDGKTAIDFPNLFCDLQSEKTWSLIRKWYPYTPEEMSSIIDETSPDGLLSYNRKRQKFVIVDSQGKYLRDY